MAHCKECQKSIFIEKWGEFKCKRKKCIVYNPSTQAEVCVENKVFKEKKEK